MKRIPDKVVGRLAQYRRLLAEHLPKDKRSVFSHELASMMQITASQVRRDLMHVGSYGVPRHGYDVAELIARINALLDLGKSRIALVGIGNLGRALIAFLNSRRGGLCISAAFDSDPTKTGRLQGGVPCHPMESLAEVVGREGIRIAVLAVPAPTAQEVADNLVRAGVRGIVNFAPVPLRVPVGIALEEIDVTCALEKVAYFTTQRVRGEREGQT